MALTDNLISYWKMDEASGNALDAVGTNPLTAVNGPASVPGKIGAARSLVRSSGQYFTHASNSDFQVTADYTFAAWVYFNSFPAAMAIAIKGQLIAGTCEWALIAGGSSVLRYGRGGALNSGTVNVNVTGIWYYVMCWQDSVNLKLGLCVNNQASPDLISIAAINPPANDPFYIGNDSGTTRYLDGYVDEVGFWKRTLTSAERTTLWNGGAGLSYPFVTGPPNAVRAGHLARMRR